MINSINSSTGDLIKEYQAYSDNDVLSIINQVTALNYLNTVLESL